MHTRGSVRTASCALSLAWRNRMIREQAFPLPTRDDGSFSVTQAVATLLCLSLPEMVMLTNELTGFLAREEPAGARVVNCFVCAYVQYHAVVEPEVLRGLAEGPYQHALTRRRELCLIMPPSVAMLIPISSHRELAACGRATSPDPEVAYEEVAHEMMMQGHRFVTVHHCVPYPWVCSLLGYLVLLIRSGGFGVTRLQRLRCGLGHGVSIRGCVMSRALELGSELGTDWRLRRRESVRIPNCVFS